MGYFFECRRLGLVRFFLGGGPWDELGTHTHWGSVGGVLGAWPLREKNRQIPDGVFLFECRCLGFVWFLLGGVLGRYWGHIGGPWGVFWEPPPLNKQKPDKSQTGCFCLSVVVWDLSGSFWGGHWEVLGTHWGSVGGRGSSGSLGPPPKTHTNRRGGVIV